MKLAMEPWFMKSYQEPIVKQGTFILSKWSEQSPASLAISMTICRSRAVSAEIFCWCGSFLSVLLRRESSTKMRPVAARSSQSSPW